MYKKVEFSVDSPDFLQLSKNEKNKRLSVKYFALSMLKNGCSFAEVVKQLGYARSAISKWYNAYKKHGLDGLLEKKSPGRPPLLSKDKQKKLAEKVLEEQKTRPGGRITEKDIRVIATDEFNVTYAPRSLYAVLGKNDLSWISGRSIHPKANLEVQENFKKNFKRRLQRYYQRISI